MKMIGKGFFIFIFSLAFGLSEAYDHPHLGHSSKSDYFVPQHDPSHHSQSHYPENRDHPQHLRHLSPPEKYNRYDQFRQFSHPNQDQRVDHRSPVQHLHPLDQVDHLESHQQPQTRSFSGEHQLLHHRDLPANGVPAARLSSHEALPSHPQQQEYLDHPEKHPYLPGKSENSHLQQHSSNPVLFRHFNQPNQHEPSHHPSHQYPSHQQQISDASYFQQPSHFKQSGHSKEHEMHGYPREDQHFRYHDNRNPASLLEHSSEHADPSHLLLHSELHEQPDQLQEHSHAQDVNEKHANSEYLQLLRDLDLLRQLKQRKQLQHPQHLNDRHEGDYHRDNQQLNYHDNEIPRSGMNNNSAYANTSPEARRLQQREYSDQFVKLNSNENAAYADQFPQFSNPGHFPVHSEPNHQQDQRSEHINYIDLVRQFNQQNQFEQQQQPFRAPLQGTHRADDQSYHGMGVPAIGMQSNLAYSNPVQESKSAQHHEYRDHPMKHGYPNSNENAGYSDHLSHLGHHGEYPLLNQPNQQGNNSEYSSEIQPHSYSREVHHSNNHDNNASLSAEAQVPRGLQQGIPDRSESANLHEKVDHLGHEPQLTNPSLSTSWRHNQLNQHGHPVNSSHLQELGNPDQNNQTDLSEQPSNSKLFSHRREAQLLNDRASFNDSRPFNQSKYLEEFEYSGEIQQQINSTENQQLNDSASLEDTESLSQANHSEGLMRSRQLRKQTNSTEHQQLNRSASLNDTGPLNQTIDSEELIGLRQLQQQINSTEHPQSNNSASSEDTGPLNQANHSEELMRSRQLPKQTNSTEQQQLNRSASLEDTGPLNHANNSEELMRSRQLQQQINSTEHLLFKFLNSDILASTLGNSTGHTESLPGKQEEYLNETENSNMRNKSEQSHNSNQSQQLNHSDYFQISITDTERLKHPDEPQSHSNFTTNQPLNYTGKPQKDVNSSETEHLKNAEVPKQQKNSSQPEHFEHLNGSDVSQNQSQLQQYKVGARFRQYDVPRQVNQSTNLNKEQALGNVSEHQQQNQSESPKDDTSSASTVDKSVSDLELSKDINNQSRLRQNRQLEPTLNHSKLLDHSDQSQQLNHHDNPLHLLNYRRQFHQPYQPHLGGYSSQNQQLNYQVMPHEVCLFEKMHGPCHEELPRYFYNLITRNCEKFIYGGCHGNPNNFLRLEECQSVCMNMYNVHPNYGMPLHQFWQYDHPQPMNNDVGYRNLGLPLWHPGPALVHEVCSLEKKLGPCNAIFHRYFYNAATKSCETFIYGGCYGNANNFLTKEECEFVCMGL